MVDKKGQLEAERQRILEREAKSRQRLQQIDADLGKLKGNTEQPRGLLANYGRNQALMR